MRLRIVSRVTNIGRHFYVERRALWFFWHPIGSPIGYMTEPDAKAFAEEYAKGDWVTDSAHFKEGRL